MYRKKQTRRQNMHDVFCGYHRTYPILYMMGCVLMTIMMKHFNRDYITLVHVNGLVCA